MLEHLVDGSVQYEPEAVALPGTKVTPIDKASPEDILNAQINTAAWLEELGVDDPTDKIQTEQAQKAFTALAASQSPLEKRQALTKINSPQAVRHLVGMLTAYDWKFVEQAQELRGYAVSQLLEETKHPDAKIRLKALELLGKVTEVALFTERVEVKKTDLSDSELDARIKEKLERMAKIVDVTDVTDVDIINQDREQADSEGANEPQSD